MRRTWLGMGWRALVLLGLAGCASTDNTTLKPPLREEYVVPPGDDARFSAPIRYPKETLNNFGFKKQQNDGSQPPGGGFRGPASGGMSSSSMRGY